MQTYTATEIINSFFDMFYHLYEVEFFQGFIIIASAVGIIALIVAIITPRFARK